MTIRLVKGAYWDCETAWATQNGWAVPVETEKWRCDSQFESLARMLLDHRRVVRPAFASHNVRSLASVMAWAEAVGAMPTEFELQMGTLSNHNLAELEKQEWDSVPFVRVYRIVDWFPWFEFQQFCQKNNIRIGQVIVDLDFQLLE